MRMPDEAGHRACLPARKALERVSHGQCLLWSDWTVEIGPWLVRARAKAMAEARPLQPIGRGAAMSDPLAEYGFGSMDEKTRASLLKIIEHLPEVEAWRECQERPGDLNHPALVWERFQKSTLMALSLIVGSGGTTRQPSAGRRRPRRRR